MKLAKFEFTREGSPTLNCQSCGDVLKYLSDAEAQEVSFNPYNFIVFCDECIKKEHYIDPEFRE